MPERFSVSKGVLRLDRFMTYVILVGGIGIIAAVFGIFVFIGSVIWPLFQSPTLTPLRELPLATSSTTLVGLDERSELPYSYDGSTDLQFHSSSSKTTSIASTGTTTARSVGATPYSFPLKRTLPKLVA